MIRQFQISELFGKLRAAFGFVKPSYLFPDVLAPSLHSDTRFFGIPGDDHVKMSFFRTFVSVMQKKDPDFGKGCYVDFALLQNDIDDNPFNALCCHGVASSEVMTRLILVLDEKSGLPVWYDIIPGNVLVFKKIMRTIPERTEAVMNALLGMQRYSWEQGVAAQAFYESGDIDTAIRMAYESANRQIGDGRCAQIGPADAVTDPCAIGEVLIAAADITQDPYLIRAKERLIRWALNGAPRNVNGLVYHLDSQPQFWVDSFYMLPPFLAKAGFPGEAVRQLDGYWNVLYDHRSGLLYHIWDDKEERFVHAAHWGVGNGWAVAGMARVISQITGEGMYAGARRRFVYRVNNLIRKALTYQMADGAFHDIMDDPVSFREINSAQMFAYTIYRGVSEGWMDQSLLPYADKMYEAAQREVDAYGFVHNVCGAPDFNSPGIAPEGQAFYLLMENARMMAR